jgi:hypothetical protein
MAEAPKSIEELKESIKKQFEISSTDFANAFESMVSGGDKINKAFGQARARVIQDINLPEPVPVTTTQCFRCSAAFSIRC